MIRVIKQNGVESYSVISVFRIRFCSLICGGVQGVVEIILLSLLAHRLWKLARVIVG
jgi:hypothetical protein